MGKNDFCNKLLLFRPLLRIFCEDSSAKYPLGDKLGCDAENVAPKLLKYAVEIGVDVAGIWFVCMF